MIDDITYCLSRYCNKQEECQRHYSNNNLTGEVYSASDFSVAKDKECKYFMSKQIKQHYCEKCGGLINGEFKYGHLGQLYVICNNCGENNYLWDEDGIVLTKDNVKFPEHYFSFKNGSCINNDRINEWVTKCIDRLEKNPDIVYTTIGSGDTIIYVTRNADEGVFVVDVCKDYYETEIEIKS